MSITNIFDQLTRDEGFRAEPYDDSRGFKTVGIGHNLDANPLPGESYPMTLDRAQKILVWDVNDIYRKLINDLPWVDSLPEVITGVLINMAFNLGAAGLEEFHHMLSYIQSGEYATAALAGKASLWYTQVGDRAKRLMEQLATGEWQ